jgi:hypothetical protein
MASSSETGHAVNISNFKLLIDRGTGLNASYNPSNPALTIVNMTAQWTTTKTAQNDLTTALANIKQPINAREALFQPLTKLVTRIIGSLNSTTASKNVKKDVKGIADTLRGFRPKKPKITEGVTGTATEQSISNSQQGYVQKADHFKQLIELLKTIPEYAPNETELQTVTLDGLYDDLDGANNNIGTILTTAINARITRDNNLYAPGTGIIDVAAACKLI